MLLSGCSSIFKNAYALTNDVGAVEVDSKFVSNEQTLLECIPAYEYRNVLPFRIRLTANNKLMCSIEGYGDVYLLAVDGEKVKLSDITNGYYVASKESEVEVMFEDTEGKKFKKCFYATDFVEEVANPVFVDSPTFDCVINGEFVKYSENIQKIKTPYYCGALKGVHIEISFDSSIDYADISLRDNAGMEYYPTRVTDNVAVFEPIYIPGDFNVYCPLGVKLEDVSVRSVTSEITNTKSLTVDKDSNNQQVITFLSDDLTATAKLITPGDEVYYFSRSSISTAGATYEVLLPNTLAGKYTVVMDSKYKIKELRRIQE